MVNWVKIFRYNRFYCIFISLFGHLLCCSLYLGGIQVVGTAIAILIVDRYISSSKYCTVLLYLGELRTKGKRHVYDLRGWLCFEPVTELVLLVLTVFR
jgi:hypothetical protein